MPACMAHKNNDYIPVMIVESIMMHFWTDGVILFVRRFTTAISFRLFLF
jgi:hypothetical protein